MLTLLAFFLTILRIHGEITRLNIIFILADDIGSADFNYSSQVNDIPTPNVDFVAKAGLILENYYVHSLCTPTRASILTGRYSINTGLTSVLVPGTRTSVNGLMNTSSHIT
jgi:arylsulfatase A-like enzyme